MNNPKAPWTVTIATSMFIPNAKGCNASEASQDEPQPAEELRHDRHEREWSWNVHRAREQSHRGGDAETSEPPQHFLRTVGEEDHSQHQPEHRRRGAIIRGT